MQIKKAYTRGKKYCRNNGFKATLRRALLEIRNELFFNRDIVFRIDLTDRNFEISPPAEKYNIETFLERSKIPNEFIKCLTRYHAAELLENDFKRRFAKGAVLWTIKDGGEFIGHTWILAGRTLKPYYLPLTPYDVHIFDTFIFPEHRRKKINSILMNYVFKQLKAQGIHRVYGEVAEWNTPQAKALIKNHWIQVGFASKRIRRNKITVTWWS